MSEFVFCETTQFSTQLLASYYYTVTLNGSSVTTELLFIFSLVYGAFSALLPPKPQRSGWVLIKLYFWFEYNPVEKQLPLISLAFVVAGLSSKDQLTVMHPNELLLRPLWNVMLS